MNSSTAAAQGGFPFKDPTQTARNGAGASSKSRRRSGTTSDPSANGIAIKESNSDGEDESLKQSSKSATKALVELHRARPKGPFKPTVAHQLIYLMNGKQLPPDMFKRPIHPLKSYATPSQFDLSSLTIPLTAKEILTFFPNHVDIPEIQHRFCHSDIKGSFQANFINAQYRLQGIMILIPMDCRSHLKKSKAYLGGAFPTKPTTFTTSHYTFVPGEANGFDNIRIPYPLIDCGFHVHPRNFPMGPDSGPFTKALIQVQLAGNTALMLSEVDTFIVAMGISRELEDGYTDAGFQARHRVMVKEYKAFLQKNAGKKNIRFDH